MSNKFDKPGMKSYVIGANTDITSLPKDAWVQQGIKAYAALVDRSSHHSHLVYVREDGFLWVSSNVPPRP